MECPFLFRNLEYNTGSGIFTTFITTGLQINLPPERTWINPVGDQFVNTCFY